jgi:hypothetical protein
VLFLATTTFTACKQDKTVVVDESLPEDFEIFYSEFHEDSLFQINHITFPLEGATQAKGSNIDMMIPVKWDKDSWIMHKPFNDHNNTFERKFYMIGPVVVEKIADRNQFFFMERRYKKFGKDWLLIYYAVSN